MTDDRMANPGTAAIHTVPVGLEESEQGPTLVHALDLLGCVAWGPSRDEALAAFPRALREWLEVLARFGGEVPGPETELEISVDEWIRSDVDLIGGESVVLFDADLRELTRPEVERSLHRLGDLRGLLLAKVRRIPDAGLDVIAQGGFTLRTLLDELARAQWWTLTRLGASPMAEVPGRTLARLDTAMALVVQQFTELPEEARARRVELDGESWTPRKVLRRLLWLEWSIGRAALSMLPEDD